MANLAARVTGIYLVLGIAWIVFSDRILLATAPDLATLAWVQTAKGLGYVAVTAAVIFALVKRGERRVEKAQRDLKQSESRLRSAILEAPFPVMVHAEDGEVLVVSKAWTSASGYQPEDLPTYADWVRLAEPTPDEGNQNSDSRLYDSHSLHRAGHIRLRARDGTSRIWDISSAPSGALPDGRRLVCTMAMDVTESVRLQQQIMEAQKLETVGMLAGGIAHDFNNLLTAVLGYNELLGAHIGGNAAAMECSRNLSRAAERAANLTRRLLLFARRQPMESRDVEVNEVVKPLVELIRGLLPENIALTCQLSAESCMVRMDPTELEQVVMNLAVNARDATFEGGAIGIRTGRATPEEVASAGLPEGDYALVEVSDTGTGMDTEVLEHIFEPFFTTKSTGEGTGLGLPTSLQVVREAGGELHVESAAGRGTRVRVLLPRIEAAAAAVPSTRAAAQCGGSETVLFVEDEPMIQEVAALALRGAGFQVLTADDGEEGLRLGSEYPGPIHLLVTDWTLPRLSGHELARRLREKRPELRVLVTSGQVAEAERLADLDFPAAYLPKPFTPSALSRKVREVLDEAS